MLIDPEKTSVSIVLLGDFNPAIFSPLWLKQMGLISSEEYNSAEIEVIHRDITSFRLEWVKISVQPTRFAATTEVSPHIRMSDLVVRIFGEYLSHTPLRVLGINTSIEFSVGSEEIRNKIGHKLAPPDAWGEWAPRIKEKNQLGRGGMRRLAMEQKGLDDRGAGHIIADIRPSKDKDTNIVMEINDQYELKLSEDSQENTKCIIEYIDKNFEKSIKNSEWIVEQIMSLKNAV